MRPTRALIALIGLNRLARHQVVGQPDRDLWPDSQPEGPFDPNTIQACTQWYNGYWKEDTCQQIRDWMFGIKPEDFTLWNPSVTLDCGNWKYQSYCVSITPAEERLSSSLAASPTPTLDPPRETLEREAKPWPTTKLEVMGWEHLGCYTYSGGRALSNRSSTPEGGSLSVSGCEWACLDQGWSFAGLKSGNECWCSNYVTGGLTFDENECNVPCAGNTSEICGGEDSLNIFQVQIKRTRVPATLNWESSMTTTSPPSTTTSTATINTEATTPANSWQELGCYMDTHSSETRPLGVLMDLESGGLTVETCQVACKNKGFLLAGVVRGSECWCDSEFRFPKVNRPVTWRDCDMACPGNGGQLCGAEGRMYLYRFAVPPSPWFGIGCYAEERTHLLGQLVNVIGGEINNTRQNCIDRCDGGGYTYAGVRHARECWCDGPVDPSGKPARNSTAAW